MTDTAFIKLPIKLMVTEDDSEEAERLGLHVEERLEDTFCWIRREAIVEFFPVKGGRYVKIMTVQRELWAYMSLEKFMTVMGFAPADIPERKRQQ